MKFGTVVRTGLSSPTATNIFFKTLTILDDVDNSHGGVVLASGP